jgi:predicted HAD superfamily phosphohydrolase YqeG
VQVIRATRSVYFDVDDTLVIWDWKSVSPDGVGTILIVDPTSGTSERVFPHNRHVQLMRQFKARGHTVVVWSQGGHAWAEAVCKQLGIETLVDYVMDKPNWYVDDLHSSAWMKAPIFLDPTDPLKDKRWGIPEENDLEEKK